MAAKAAILPSQHSMQAIAPAPPGAAGGGGGGGGGPRRHKQVAVSNGSALRQTHQPQQRGTRPLAKSNADSAASARIQSTGQNPRKLAPARPIAIAPRPPGRPLRPLLAARPSASTAAPSASTAAPSASIAHPIQPPATTKRALGPSTNARPPPKPAPAAPDATASAAKPRKGDQTTALPASRSTQPCPAVDESGSAHLDGLHHSTKVGEPQDDGSTASRGGSRALSGDADHVNAAGRAARSSLSLSSSPESSTSSALGFDARSTTNSLQEDTAPFTDDLNPKMEWVLPARAKPGRKPSDIEPPTKRKAQNRASQRAFRERRQSYVASLEAKIAEQDRRAMNTSFELQRAARRLKDENDALSDENERLRLRLLQLERGQRNGAIVDVAMLSDSNGGVPARKSATGLAVASLLADEEQSRNSLAQTTASSETPRHSSSISSAEHQEGQTGGGDCGFCTRDECVCIGDGVLDFSAGEDQPTNTEVSVKAERETPPPVSPHTFTRPADEHFRPHYHSYPSSTAAAHTSSLSGQTAASKLPLRRARHPAQQKLWYTVSNTQMRPPHSVHAPTSHREAGTYPSSLLRPLWGAPPSHSVQICPTISRNRWSALHNSSRRLSSMPSAAASSVTSASSGCLYTGATTDPFNQHRNNQPQHASPSLSLPQGVPAAGTTHRQKRTIWPVYSTGSLSAPGTGHAQTRGAKSTPFFPFSTGSTVSLSRSGGEAMMPYAPLQSPTATIFRMRKQPSSGGAGATTSSNDDSPVCSGDPSNCSACATDPALAAFCKAVSAHLDHGSHVGNANVHGRGEDGSLTVAPVGAVILDAGNALPLRRPRRVTITADATPVAATLGRANAGASTSTAESVSLRRHHKRTRSGRLADEEENGFAARTDESSRPRLWSTSQSYHANDISRSAADNAVASSSSSSTTTFPFPSMSLYTNNGGQQKFARAAGMAQHPPLLRRPTVESIPDAWRRIKQHPSFADWQGQQGGLDLLADVVARKSSPLSTPTAQEETSKGHRHSSERHVRIAEDGAPDRPASSGTRREASVDGRGARATGDEENSGSEEEGSPSEAAATKRRRLYVERKSVDNVLALMDRSSSSAKKSPGATSTSSSSRSSPSARRAIGQPYDGHSHAHAPAHGGLGARHARSSSREDSAACACPLSKLM